MTLVTLLIAIFLYAVIADCNDAVRRHSMSRMTTLALQNIPNTQHILIPVVDYMENGTDPDTTESLAIGGHPTGLVVTVGDLPNPADPTSFTPNPTTGRWVKLAGVGECTGSLAIYASGVPQGGVLTVPFTVGPAPNRSHVEPAGPVLGPFDN